jgi:integrase
MKAGPSLTSGNVRVRLPGINTATKRLADGTSRTYFYHRATRIKLTGQPGSPEFLASLANAKASRNDYVRGTLASLVRSYEESPDFLKLEAESRKIAAYLFRKIDAEYGTLPVSALAERKKVRPDFLAWRDRMAVKHPRGADNTLGHLAKVLAWAEERGMIDENPLRGWKRVYSSDRSDMIWLPEHIKAFCAVASPELQMALMLALHTGQRQGDLRALTWPAYDGEAITLRQSKRKRRVRVPCTKALKDALDKAPRKAALILLSPTGKPWDRRGFNRAWKAASDEAGLGGLHFHDLRGTAITMLSEAGCTPQEIAAITGHSLRNIAAILDKYLSRTRILAENAIAKLERRFAIG